jgi:hypothetical protein
LQAVRINEARLQPPALAFNLATFLRCIELPEAMADWSLTSLQLKLIKIGARVVRHARAITFQLAEVAVTGAMVRAILCCDPSSPSATAMRVTLKLPDGERKRQEKSVRRAEERGRLTKMMQIRRPSRPLSAGQAEVDTAQGTDHLISRRKQTNLPSSGRPLGECRSKPRVEQRGHMNGPKASSS